MGTTADLIGQLVAIDSVNPSLVAGAAGEEELATFVAGWLRRAGLEVSLQEAAPGRPNVIAIARGSGGGRSLMLNAHLDTVGVGGMPRAHTPVVREGRLYGRGAYDMKGGLAAAMLAAARLAGQRLRGDVIFTGVVDEEYASIGTSAVVEKWRADAAIITEPTELELGVAHKGFVWLEIETRGVAAHGSRPDLGVDAIAQMGHVLVGLRELDRSLRASPSHPLLRSGSLHASLIEGGQELSTYPERCLLSIERRTVPGETPALVEGQIEAILEGLAASDPTFSAEVRTTLVRPPFAVAQDAEIVSELRAQTLSVRGQEPGLVGHAAWMDSAILAEAGIPTVLFGPSGSGAHAVEEWVDLDSVERCVDILAATAEAFCGR